jgi:Flp pilus assembly pilin Flp
MTAALSRLARDEDGAVTVDFVVLSAAVIGMAIVVIVPVLTGSESVAVSTASFIEAVPVGAD